MNESRMKREGFSPFGALCDSLSSSSEAERTRYQRFQTKSNQERSRCNLLADQYERQRLYDRSERTKRREGFYPDARLSSDATPDRSDAERHRKELDAQHRERVQRDKRIQERKEAEKRREGLQNNSDRSRSNYSSSSSSYSNPRPCTSGYQRPATSYWNNIRPTFRGEAYQNILGYNYSSYSSSSSGSSSGNIGGNLYCRGIGDPSWQRGKY